MRPANEAPADDQRTDGLRVETDELLLAAEDDEASDDEVGEPTEADVTVVTRPEPRRAPRLTRTPVRRAADAAVPEASRPEASRPEAGQPDVGETEADGLDDPPVAAVPRPAAEPLAEQDPAEPVIAAGGSAGEEPESTDSGEGLGAGHLDAGGPGAEGLTAGEVGAEESGAEQPGAEGPGAEEPGAEVPGAEVPGTGEPDAGAPDAGGESSESASTDGASTGALETAGTATERDIITADADVDASAEAGVSTADEIATAAADATAGSNEPARSFFVEEAASTEVTGDANPRSDVPHQVSPPEAEPAEVRVRRRSSSRRDRHEGEDATQPPDLLSAVERLRSHVATLNLSLNVEEVSEARKEREGMISQLDDYILPRLRRKDAPLLAVIGGSTGAGKSTLTNSLVRREVSRSGVLRPTTRSPVLVHHPFDSGAFLSQRILPRLTRVTSEAPEPMQPIDPSAPRITGLRLVPHDGMTPGMAIIDAPDIDSLVETNRDLAVQLLQAADLWIFVTTAARYADATPWQMLRTAAERGVAVAVVLDRVPPEALAELRVHLAQRLRERGLGGAPLFVIPETEPVNGFLPEEIVQPLQQWLRRVAGDERSRTVIAERTLKGVLGSLPERTLTLADAADAQALAWYNLKQEIDAVFEPARERLLRSMTDGSLLGGAVAARWQEFVADGEFVRRLDAGPGTFAERISAAVQRDGEVVEPLDVPVTEAIGATITAAVRAATEAVTSRWRRYPYGVALADQPVPEFEATLERSIRDWRVLVSGGVTAAAQSRESAVDEETAADVLFVVSIDERGDGADSADSIGAARRILGRFLGDDEVRVLVAEARSDLVARAAVVLDQERQRLEKLLSGGGATARGESLRIAAAVLKDAR